MGGVEVEVEANWSPRWEHKWVAQGAPEMLGPKFRNWHLTYEAIRSLLLFSLLQVYEEMC